MARFLVSRMLIMIPLILGITFISFVAMSLVPGNFVSNLALDPHISPAGDQTDGGGVRPRSAVDGPLSAMAMGGDASELRLFTGLSRERDDR